MSLLPVGFGASGDDYEITDSLRFRAASNTYLNRTPASSSNRKTWTYSAWVKLGNLEGHTLFAAGDYTQSQTRDTEWINITDTGKLFWGYAKRVSGTYTAQSYVYSQALFRDPSAWYHFLVVKDVSNTTTADRVIFYVNGVRQEVDVTSAVVDTDGRVNDSAAEHKIGVIDGAYAGGWSDGYITEVNFIDGQALDADDFGQYDSNGTWKAKQYTGTYGTNGFYLPMKPTTQAELQNTVLYTGDGTAVSVANTGYAPDFVWIKNRDDAAHHRLYDTVRGSQKMLSSSQSAAEQTKTGGLTSFDSDGFSVGNDGAENTSGDEFVAWTWDAGDNQTSTGISSVLYTGSGQAQSIKGFGFSPDLILFKNRAAASPLLIDSVRGPFLELQTNSTGAETSNNGTRIASIDADGFSFANTAVSGLNASGNNYVAWGWDAGDGDPVTNTNGSITSTVKANDATGFSIVSWAGSSATATVGHGLSTAPKVIIAKNRDASTEWPVYHDSVNSGGGSYLRLDTTSANTSSSIIWTGSPTSSVINVGSYSYVNSNNMIAYCFSEVSGVSKFSTYTGTGSAGNAITGLGFRPGFLMIKETSSTGNWAIVDGTRSPFGEVTGDYLYANLSQAEGGGSAPLQFDSDGFTINSGDSDTNSSGQTYIYMAFKGSYSDHVSPLNTDGDIDSRVKANTSKGFSIVSYEGNNGSNQTVGHGLGTTPSMFIIKNRTDATSWPVYHKDISTPLSNAMYLNSTNAAFSWAYWGTGGLSSTVFPVHYGSADVTNQSGKDYIAYCFAEVAGYSKIGSYTGNASTNGPVVTTGFRPAWIMTKGATVSSGWHITDTRRYPQNDTSTSMGWLDANSTAAEGDYRTYEVTDTGFQVLDNGSAVNGSGETYIYMAFADTADAVFNFDASGNKNNWIPNNINSNAESESTYDLMKDTPSLVDENAGNFATLNPVDSYASGLSNGNLTFTNGSGAAYKGISTFVIEDIADSQKYYVEYTSDAGYLSGIVTTSNSGSASNASYSDIRGYYSNGNKYTGTSASSYGGAFTSADKLAMLIGDGKLEFFKNNVSQGVAFTGLTGSWKVATVAFGAAGVGVSYNFGQRPFAYTPPAGSKKLNTFNLPDSTIEDGSDYFNTVLYSGNSSTQSITGVGFQPDLVWAKDRGAVVHHTWTDAVRGVHLDLFSSSNSQESNDTNGLTAFNADGYSLGSSTNHNVTGHTYVGWNWLAGNSTSTNTAGSVNSTVSVNSTAGFSIVGFTSPGSGSFTIGHGLSASPDLIIMKRRASNANWGIFHSAVCTNEDKYFIFNTNELISYTDYWGTALPTSTVFGANVGASAIASEAMIAYCWRAVEGYSSFGSYTGSGSTDGPFVYTGFRPAFIMIKLSSNQINAASWQIYDTTRNTFNVIPTYLFADSAGAESDSAATYFNADILSNGFKLRADNTYGINQSGATYIYMAFAENPFKNANAR